MKQHTILLLFSHIQLLLVCAVQYIIDDQHCTLDWLFIISSTLFIQLQLSYHKYVFSDVMKRVLEFADLKELGKPVSGSLFSQRSRLIVLF